MEKLMQKAKKTKVIFTVLLVVGIIGICVAAYLFVPDTNTSKDAVNMKNNPAEGANAYIEMIGL